MNIFMSDYRKIQAYETKLVFFLPVIDQKVQVKVTKFTQALGTVY